MNIRGTAAATAREARAYLSQLMPTEGVYEVHGPRGAVDVEINEGSIADAADALPLWRELFPVDGDYIVKAKPPAGHDDKRFAEWWLERLVDEGRTIALSLRHRMIEQILAFAERHGGSLPDPGVLELLARHLSDFRLAVKWSIAQPIPPDALARLRAMGFSDREVLDWPGLAYRWGRIESELSGDFSWDKLLSIARSIPLQQSDHVAIAYARATTGQLLTPVVVRDAERSYLDALQVERARVQRHVEASIRNETSAGEMARTLARESQGAVRDFDRVARTEIQDARLRGAWVAEKARKQWSDTTLVYRSLSATPCNGCLLLYKTASGTPRLYTVAHVEADDAKGYNRGHYSTWHVRIGPTHPNCLDSPWLTYMPELQAVFAREAPKWQQTFARRGLA